MSRVLVCGGRDYQDRRRLTTVLDAAILRLGLSSVIHDGTMGVGHLTAEWAAKRKIEAVKFKAEWGRLGRAAGHLRNELMLAEGKPDLVIAFPGDRDTANMVAQAVGAGVKVIKIDWPEGAENAYPDEPDASGQMALLV